MKIKYLVFAIFLIVVSCSNDDDFATINGRVQRAINGNGVANQSVIVMLRKHTGSGLFSTIKDLDRREVVTDANGNFSVAFVNDPDAFISIVYEGNDDYFGTGAYIDYSIDEPLIINVDRLVKFKIFVKNKNPFDENDLINISFFAGLSNTVRTGIENFGVANKYHPEETLPGGGVIGAYDDTSWTGSDVNSIVYYSVVETAKDINILWNMTKNGVETEGITDDIQFDIEELNSYLFEY